MSFQIASAQVPPRNAQTLVTSRFPSGSLLIMMTPIVAPITNAILLLVIVWRIVVLPRLGKQVNIFVVS